MLDAQDIATLRQMFAEQDRRFVDAMKENNKDLKIEIREETHALIAASEKRVIETIVSSIGEILDTSVLPQIAELQRDTTIVKQHLQLA